MEAAAAGSKWWEQEMGALDGSRKTVIIIIIIITVWNYFNMEYIHSNKQNDKHKHFHLIESINIKRAAVIFNYIVL